MSVKAEHQRALEEWCNSLPRVPQNSGPAKGTVAGSLVVLERLQKEYSLDIQDHLTKSGTQIRGASGRAVARILERFGETRQYVSEGGRTNRGLRAEIEKLLAILDGLDLDALPTNSRNDILEEAQRLLVKKVQDFFGRQRVEFVFDPSLSIWALLNGLLGTAAGAGKEGPVAQYLVGAKLALRFPNREIDNRSYSTADAAGDLPGDFTVGDTVFHVTVAPQPALFDKCKANLRQGLRPYVLVPSGVVEGARILAEQRAPGQITVTSVEKFVGQNIEELASFSNDQLVTGLRALLETYNTRTAEVEIDKSMLIKIPANLGRRG